MDDERNQSSTTVVHTITPPSRGSTAEPDWPAGSMLPQELLCAVNDSPQETTAIERIKATIEKEITPALLTHLVREPSGSLCVPDDAALLERLPLRAAERMHCWANEACRSGKAEIHRLSGAHRWNVITVPVLLRNRLPEVLCAVFEQGSIDAQRVAGTLQLAAYSITLWHAIRDARRAERELSGTSAVVELLSDLDNSHNLKQACYLLVNNLGQYLNCDRVALGLSRRGKFDCRLTAVSGLSDFDKRCEFTEQLEAALNEALLRNEVTLVSSDDDQHDAGTLVHQNLLESVRCRSLISTPLCTPDGEQVGAWMILDGKSISDLEQTLHFVRATQTVIGSRLAMLRRMRVGAVRRIFAAVVARLGARKLTLLMLACTLSMALMAIPINYKVRCDCQLEPVSRRFVAAPYEGTLQESLVEAGQIVSAGQVLARMDGRELRWELSGLEAEYESEKKKRDAAAARDEVAMAQQSNLEMQRLDVKMQLIRHRLDNLDVKSPIDGVVIAGDLKKSEGAPLSIGQALFEIGPLEKMIVEVAIPERDILYVSEGMAVDIRLNAAPNKPVTGTIVRVAPRSETRGNESVYVAEVELPNRDASLRPGMKGSAKVISDPHPLGWNLLHKPWESLAMMVGC